jgi:predicted glycosyltransferase
MKANGHEFLVIARDREVIFILLEFYKIKYINRGKGSNSFIGKLVYMLKADLLFLKNTLKFSPDLFLSFSSPYAAQVAFLLGKPHIALNDTEHTDKLHQKITYPFSKTIITPESYSNDLGSKHIKFNNVIESLYLHNNYYTPDESIYDCLGIEKNTKYVIMRFVSWNAHHDFGQKGLDFETKKKLVKMLRVKYKVFISSEGKLENCFEKYQIKIPAHRMHDVLHFASIYIGESGTMASESAILGTPVVYINSLPLMCYLKLEQENGLLKHFSSSDGVLNYIQAIIKQDNIKEETMEKRNQMIKNFIDPVQFMTWFIENYPESVKIMKENPDYQYRFK